MSHSATIFSRPTPLRFWPARLAVPITAMFSFSLADNRLGDRGALWQPTKEAPANAAAPLRMKSRREKFESEFISRLHDWQTPFVYPQIRDAQKCKRAASRLPLPFLVVWPTFRRHLHDRLAQIVQQKGFGHHRIYRFHRHL